MPDATPRIGFVGSRGGARLVGRIAPSRDVPVNVFCAGASAAGGETTWSGVTRSSPAEVAATSDLVIIMLEGEDAARAATLGPGGVLSRAHARLIVIELSPIAPWTMVEIAARFKAVGARACGGALQFDTHGAEGPAFRAYVDNETLEDEHAVALIATFAAHIVPTGATGTSKAMSIVGRLLACVNAAATAEGIAMGEKAGIPADVLIPLLLKGSGASQALRHRYSEGRQAETPNVETPTGGSFQSDLKLAQQLGRRLGHSVFFGSLAAAACRGANQIQAIATC